MQDNGRKISDEDEAAMKKSCEEHREYLTQFATHAEVSLEVLENFVPKDVKVSIILRRNTGDDSPNTASAMMFTNDDPQKLVTIMEFLKRGMFAAKQG